MRATSLSIWPRDIPAVPAPLGSSQPDGAACVAAPPIAVTNRIRASIFIRVSARVAISEVRCQYDDWLVLAPAAMFTLAAVNEGDLQGNLSTTRSDRDV